MNESRPDNEFCDVNRLDAERRRELQVAVRPSTRSVAL
jgi:hypothetical protein